MTSSAITPKANSNASLRKRVRKYRAFYVFLLPAILFYLVFQYGSMYGIVTAFQNFNPLLGIEKSKYVGFANFASLFKSSTNFLHIVFNTLRISFLKILFGFPAPILFALLLNELRGKRFKRITQTISYLPHFLSWIIISSLITMLVHPSEGVFNKIILQLGGKSIYFMTDSGWFLFIIVFSSVWQSIGWSSIVYIAAITSVDAEMYEAAAIEGAGRFKQAIHITLPFILPVISIMFIIQMSNVLNAGFDQIFNMYNNMVMDVADIIDTYVYRIGLVKLNYSMSTTVNLFKTVICLIFVLASNWGTKKMGQEPLI